MLSVYVTTYLLIFIFFFFSSRRRHTRSKRDWSSDCALPILHHLIEELFHLFLFQFADVLCQALGRDRSLFLRSEERRVGKECRSRWSQRYEKKKIIVEQQILIQTTIISRLCITSTTPGSFTL